MAALLEGEVPSVVPSRVASFEFTSGSITHRVYHDGTGPPVVILHELPGMTPEFLALAGRVKAAGFRVCLPLLFGRPGLAESKLATGARMAMFCIRGEFRCLASDRSSPIADWLRALCREISLRHEGHPIGVVGLCLTGNVVLSCMVEPCVVAPVMCEPSLPFHHLALGAARDRKRAALATSREELDAIRMRPVPHSLLAYRFEQDKLCTDARFGRLERELGPQCFRPRVIDASEYSSWGIRDKAHSVLTEDYSHREGHPTRRALEEILKMFRERLRTGLTCTTSSGEPAGRA